MSYAATAKLTETVSGTTVGKVKLTIRSILLSTGSVYNIDVDDTDPNVLDSVLNSIIISAVKSYHGLGLLDSVRVYP